MLLSSFDLFPFINTPDTLTTGTDGWRVQSFTPCHYASAFGHDYCLHLLIKAGGSINTTADFGRTPLMVSCEEGFVLCARVILESSSAVPGIKPSAPWTTELLRSNLEAAAAVQQTQQDKIFDIDSGDVYKMTAFYLAAHHGHADCMDLLFSHGCSINSRDSHGRTSMHAASRRAENEEALRFLLSLPGHDINRPDNQGQTAMDLTPRHSIQESILLAAGAKATADDDMVEAIRYCAHLGDNGRLEQILADLECRGVIDLPDKDFLEWHTRGFSALQYAAQGGKVKAIELLLSHGADPEAARDEEGNAPFLLASSRGQCEVLHCLKRHGVDVNIVNRHGQNAIFCAVAAHKIESLKVLLHKDDRDPIDFNRTDAKTSMSPLHVATKNSNERMISLLLQAGAQLNLRDENGFTPLGYAHTDACRRLLRQAGGV